MGIDLGGTKIELIILSNSGDIVYKKRVPAPQNIYQDTINCIAQLVKEATNVVGIKKLDSLGIGTPGTVSSASGLIKNSNSTWLNNQPINKDLEQAIGCKVFIANDANCMALSEAQDGAGKNSKVVFAIILGTGCGGGIAVSKQVHSGINGVCGELGHNPLPWMTEDEFNYAKTFNCYCGQTGCIEHFISGTGFARYYNYRNNYQTKLHSREILTLAEAGDKLANECIELFETRIAKSLGHIINILDPDIIVAAGGMSNIERIYNNVNQQLPNWVMGKECSTRFVKSKHGDASGVRGAAWLNIGNSEG
jgi:fructokinase